MQVDTALRKHSTVLVDSCVDGPNDHLLFVIIVILIVPVSGSEIEGVLILLHGQKMAFQANI